ncbi:MAG: deoxyribodipyrimidine photo-lyase [Albidovulum sp.]
MTGNDTAPVIVWFRRDLRLSDHAALSAAVATGRPVLPVFILDEWAEALGAAAKWRFEQGIAVFAHALEAMGSRLLLRRGPACDVLQSLIAETGATSVYWQRAYDRDAVIRDRAVKAMLQAEGIDACSFPGALLFEPWEVATGAGHPYAVFTPFWRSIRGREVAPPSPLPSGHFTPPNAWPESDLLDAWQMGRAMRRGGKVVRRYAGIGESVAQARLEQFLADRLPGYAQGRDVPASQVTSELSENLAWGEISPRMIWHAAYARMMEGQPGAEKFLSELAWRDFAAHLMFHTPDLDRSSWRKGWDAFPWRGDNEDAELWRRGQTGEPFVDAAMREMYVTGRMHNRARMIAASYLTKHLLTDWRVGLTWFADCLTDWDPASNAMGWQWVAGSGPDAAPYFRIFSPARQAERFDPDGIWQRRWLAEGQAQPTGTALDWYRAVPEGWGLSPTQSYPAPMIDHRAGRARALAALEHFSAQAK